MSKPPISEAAKLLGKRVSDHRRAKNLSQEKLAEGSTLHWSFIGRIERGQANITLATLLVLAETLEVDPAELVAGLHSG